MKTETQLLTLDVQNTFIQLRDGCITVKQAVFTLLAHDVSLDNITENSFVYSCQSDWLAWEDKPLELGLGDCPAHFTWNF